MEECPPLNHATRRGNISLVVYLLERGADVNALGSNGSTSLHEAAKRGREDVVRVLLERGAKTRVRLELTGGRYGPTPLRWAQLNKHDATAQLLKEHGEH